MQKVKRRNNTRKLNKDAGFSLLELLIAVVILAIIVIPLLNLFLSSNKLNIRSRQTLRATTAAQDIMEGLKAYNMEEIKAQFADPASGFYVIDSRLIKGGVAEETALEVDPGLYVFSMKELNMQGSKFDAKIEVDGRRYMNPLNPDPSKPADDPANRAYNSAAMSDARSIDKKNGTFVETDKIRNAVMESVFANGGMTTAVKAKLKASGVPDADLDTKYAELRDPTNPNMVSYKNAATFFDKVTRTLEVTLSESSETDENGVKKVDMKVTQTYVFDYNYDPVADTGGHVVTTGNMGSGVMVKDMPCGSITRIVDAATGDEKINVNLFYYPLYGASAPDKIIINNTSGAAMNLLIAKQRHEKVDPSTGMPDPSDPEYLSDPQLMAAEQSYIAEIEINDTHGFDPDKFSLKTNLGLNLVGKKYMLGASIDLPTQFSVNMRPLNQLHIFTLDGVRSPLGKAGTPGEITELIYDVEVSVYEEGAAASGFPDDMRMIVIEGSTTN